MESREKELRFQFEPKFEEVDDGLLVRDVRLLAVGVWTDSVYRTAVEYTEDALSAATWRDNGLWSRHGGGMPRSIADKVGEIRCPEFKGDAVVGDLFFHCRTQLSRDIAEMTKAGLYNYVSSEVSTVDMWDPTKQRYIAEKVVFTGVATVNKGACTTCTIAENEADEMAEDKGKEAKAELGEELATKLRELETSMGQRVEDVKAELSKSDYGERIKKLETELEDANKRIKELEDAPADPKTVHENAAELAEPDIRVMVDKRAGEVYGV